MTRLLLPLSLFINALLAFLLRNLVRRAQRVRHQPLHLNRFAPVETPRRGVSTLVILGDSRAEAWRLPKLSTMQVYNRGISGESSQQVLHRIEADVLPLQPDIVLVQAGVNDLWRLGVFNSAEKSQIINNVKQTLTTITQQLPNTYIILSTIFPLGKPPLREKVWRSAETSRAIQLINAHIRSMASERIHIFDTEPLLTNDGKTVSKRYLADYLHLNPTGYNQLNAHLLPLLKTLAEETK